MLDLFRNGLIIILDYQCTIKLKSEPKFEESIGERIKLRKQSSNKFTEYKNNVNNELNELFKKHLKCQSPSNKYKALNETKSEERKKIQVNLNKSGLANFKKDTDNLSKDDVNKTEENNKIIDIVELVLDLNDQSQEKPGKGMKILIANQIPSILLAQLKARPIKIKVK